jgi:hypothetical protein
LKCLKSSLFRNPYIQADGQARRTELAGFHSAGVLPIRFGKTGAEVLLSWEDRWDGKWVDSATGSTTVGNPVRKLNLMGGARDNAGETPVQVAFRKAKEETGGLISGAVLERMSAGAGVAWLPKGSYLLFLVDVSGLPDADLDRRFAASGQAAAGAAAADACTGVVGLHWTPLAALRRECGRGGASARVHEFALDAVKVLGALGWEPVPPPAAAVGADTAKDAPARSAIPTELPPPPISLSCGPHMPQQLNKKKSDVEQKEWCRLFIAALIRGRPSPSYIAC